MVASLSGRGNYSLHSLPVGSLISFRDALPSFESNQSLVFCKVNASQLMWAIATSGGWSDNDVQYKIITDVYVVLALCVFGVIGNAVTISVLRKDPDRTSSSTNWLLQTLALVDIVYLTASLFVQPLKALHDFTTKLPEFLDGLYPHIEPYAWPAASISQTMTIWVVLLVTVDRYIAVCLPLSRHLRSMKRTKLATSVTLVLAVLYNLPVFFERKVQHHIACSEFPPTIVKTSLGVSFVYFVVYKTLLFFMFRSGGPLALLVFINVRLYRALRKRRRRLTTRARLQNNVTMTLVAVVTVFVVCELPSLSQSSLRHLRAPFIVSESPLLCHSFLRHLRALFVILELSSSPHSSLRHLRAPFVAVVFVVCELPDALLRLLVAIIRLVTGRGEEFGVDGSSAAYSVHLDAFVFRANCLTNVLLAVNSSVNFIIYCLVGNKFREILIRLCGCDQAARRHFSGRVGARFLQTPGTGSAGGFAEIGDDNVCSYFGTVDRRDGFVWSSRLPDGGDGFAPRSPTTERRGWRRATVAGGLLTTWNTAHATSGNTCVEELETSPGNEPTEPGLRDVVDENMDRDPLTNDAPVVASESQQHSSE